MKYGIHKEDGSHAGMIELNPEFYTECCETPDGKLLPDSDYVKGDNWQTDPMNPAIMWRTKTIPEQDKEKEDKAEAFVNRPEIAAIIEAMGPAARAQVKENYKAKL